MRLREDTLCKTQDTPCPIKSEAIVPIVRLALFLVWGHSHPCPVISATYYACV